MTTLTVRLHGAGQGWSATSRRPGVRIQLNCVPWLSCSLRINAQGAVSPTGSWEEPEEWDGQTTECCLRSSPHSGGQFDD